MANKKSINPKIGPRLKDFIRELGVTQEEFGDQIGLGARHISNMIHGKRGLTVENARLMTSKFAPNIRYEWLMGYDDYKTVKDYARAKQEELAQAHSKMYENIAHKIDIWFGEDQREQVIQTVLGYFDLELYVNQEGLEELACYKRLMENTMVDNIHTLDFLDIIMQHNQTGDEREGYKEYMNFSRERATTDHAYILLHKTNGGRAYMSEEEKNRFVDEICSHIEYFEYKIHRLFEKENLREEQNG